MIIPALLKKKIVLIPGCILLLITIIIISLEYLSNSCPDAKTREIPDCHALINTYIADGDIYKTLEELLSEDPIDEDLETVINTRIFEASREELRGVNGVACSHYGFVDRNLPKAAKLYVKTHEALHLLGSGGETKTNYQAAAKHPFGMLETVFYSVYVGFKDQPLQNYPCLMAQNWVIFKTYFLHFRTQT